MVTGDGGAVAWGSPQKKLGAGGLEGWPVQRRTGGGDWFQGWRGGAPPAAGGGGWMFGRWWLPAQGVEVEDEPQALDFVSNGCKID